MPFNTQTSDFWGWYLRHNNRVIWKQLADAGMDLFAVGPSNNTQAFLDLTNVLPAISEGFPVRWPLTQAVQQTVTTAPLSKQLVRYFAYNFPQDQSNPANTANTNVIFATDNQKFYGFNDDWSAFSGYGPTNSSSLGVCMGAVTSRGYLYYGDGLNAPRKVNPSFTTATTDSLVGIALNPIPPGATNYQDYPCALVPASVFGAPSAGVIALLTSGAGYFVGEHFSVAGGSGTGMIIQVDSVYTDPLYANQINGYHVVAWGSGYVVGDVVTASEGSPAATFFVPVIPSTIGGSGSGGSGLGYAASITFTVDVLDTGSGTGGVVTCFTDANGTIVQVIVSSPGSNYTQGYVTVPAPGSGGIQGYVTVYTQVNSDVSASYGTIVGADLAGPMSFIEGRQWAVALQNSTTGHTSDVYVTGLPYGPISGTGFNAVTSGLEDLLISNLAEAPVYVSSAEQTAGFTQINITISVPGTYIDPQVDTVVLLAAADGQGVGTLYQVGIYPLSSFTLANGFYTLQIYDSVPDSFNSATNTYGVVTSLLEADIWGYTDSSGDTFGIFLNTPPTAAGFLYPTLHQGRLFATDGKTVFFSKSLDEVTTSTGLITSKWEECWPGDYQLPIALNNETILGLKSDGTNLHVGTDKSIFTVYGSDPSNFDVPSVAFAQTGILSNDLWTVIYVEGMPSGFVWLTQDYKVIHSDFSTYREIGTPIYPLLSTIDPTQIAACKLMSLTQGPYNFVVLQFFPTGGGAPVFLLWETRLQKWYRWTLPFGAFGSGYQLSAAFVYQYPATTSSSFTAGSKYIFFPNLVVAGGSNNFSMNYFNSSQPNSGVDLSNSGLPIIWRIQTAWQDLGDSTAIKTINEIELTSSYSSVGITASLYGATSQNQFTAGGTLLKTGSVVTGPLSVLQAQKLYCAGVNTTAKYYSLVFTNNAGLTGSSTLYAISSFSLEFYPMARI